MSAEPGYTGPATLVVGGREVSVEVVLRGFFQPTEGRYRWYGRVAANPELDALVTGNRAVVVLRTPEGEQEAELSDPDLWSRYRVGGTSTPPFATRH